MGRVVKYQADDSRRLGSPIPARWYTYVPPVDGALDWLRVKILFRVLLFHEKIGEKAFECFSRVAMDWVKSYHVISPECHAEYVRRVIAYTAIYEQRLGRKSIRLSERLLPIPSRATTLAQAEVAAMTSSE